MTDRPTTDEALASAGYKCPLCSEPHMPALNHSPERLADREMFDMIAAAETAGDEGRRAALFLRWVETRRPDADILASDREYRARLAVAARQPVVDGVLDEHPVMALLDKAKLWRDRGTITEAEYGMVCALVFVQMPEDQTPEEREATIEFGRRWLAEHPDIAARLGASDD